MGMKKNSSMTALILAFIGFVLITGALFSLYKSSNNNDLGVKSETEIDIANQKIEVLSNEIKDTKDQLVDENPAPEVAKLHVSSQLNEQNIPII